MNTVKAQKTDDDNKPPKYRVASDSEVIIQPRGARSQKLDHLYHLSPSLSIKSLDSTEPLEDVFPTASELIHGTLETRLSQSSSDGEFLRRLNSEGTPHSKIQPLLKTSTVASKTADVIIY